MANLKLIIVLFIVTFALISCNVEDSLFGDEIVVKGRASDPVMSPAPDSFAQNYVDVTLTTPTPGATILYTLDGTSPVNLDDFGRKVESFWEAFGNDASCRRIYNEVYRTIYSDITDVSEGWAHEIMVHVGVGNLRMATVGLCLDTLNVFSDPKYDSLSYLLSEVDPKGVDACIEVFTVMNETIITDINKWVGEIGEQDDEDVAACLVLLEEWNDILTSDIDAMVYTEPIRITGDTTLIAVAYSEDHIPSNPVQGRYIVTGAPNQPPVVSVTSPESGAEFVLGDSVTIVASASDPDGSVVKVEFFADGVKVGERTTSPWSLSWVPAMVGSYDISARATDNGGATATSSAVSINVAGPPPDNVPPTVSITRPQHNEVFQSDEPIEVRVDAHDSDGNIVKVEFYRDDQLVHTDTNAPYQYNQEALSPGAYRFRAVAYDNDDASTASSIVSIRVNERPTVSLIRPSDGASYDEGDTVYAEADASDADGDIDRVEFLLNGDLVHTDYDEPYTAQFKSLTPGTYELRARAVDNDNAHRTSAPVSFKIDAPDIPNKPPVVSISSPVEGAEFVLGDSVTIVASASDPDGSVVKVEFFADGVKVGERTTSPWSLSWVPAMVGSYDISARATDNGGATATSTPVTVYVVAPPAENVPPTVAVTNPEDGGVYYDNVVIMAMADAHDSDGQVVKVEFLLDGKVLGTDTEAPYNLPLGVLDVGTYSLRARATDNEGATTTSSAVEFHVKEYVPEPPETPHPIIRFITPRLQDLFTRFSAALINLEARDYLGESVRVDFYALYEHFASRRTHLIQMGSLMEPPYDFELPRLREGRYTFVARATDSYGQSTQANITINVGR
ncbi:MAG: Ig-like domain-containing protein [Candidatus Woesearchaeota archaeon]